MGMIGNPSKGDFKSMVRGNMIKNYPVTTDAITDACAFFGPNLPNLTGKRQWRTPAPVVVVADYVSVPTEVVERNKVVMLAADVYFVDGIAFLSTVLRQIKFIIAICPFGAFSLCRT